MNGTREHHLRQSYAGLEGQKLHVLPPMWIIDLKQMQQYYGMMVILRGGCTWEGWSKGRKLKT
jgi:hypothetical protein